MAVKQTTKRRKEEDTSDPAVGKRFYVRCEIVITSYLNGKEYDLYGHTFQVVSKEGDKYLCKSATNGIPFHMKQSSFDRYIKRDDIRLR